MDGDYTVNQGSVVVKTEEGDLDEGSTFQEINKDYLMEFHDFKPGSAVVKTEEADLDEGPTFQKVDTDYLMEFDDFKPDPKGEPDNSDRDPTYALECEEEPSLESQSVSQLNTEISSDEENQDDSSLVINLPSTSGVDRKENVQLPLEKKKRIREQNFCFFCETLVLQFARHLIRNHGTETEVLQFLSKPSKSKERKDLLTSLRKKGNYLLNAQECSKPMKKTKLTDSQDFLPCTHCLGFYARKQLWRHKKKCPENPDGHRQTQADGQNYIIRNQCVDLQLKEKVFPRMRADKISLTAKKDVLICAFGARYLQIHREKHFVNVTSRKMRELAKILIELKKHEPRITNLFLALQPQYFDAIVTATKAVAKYDKESDRYQSPTFAMNISTSLKQCCDIASIYALKKMDCIPGVQNAEVKANLKTMHHLLTTTWKFEVANQAADDLNIKKRNKITVIPLASDLRILKDYLSLKINEAVSKLQLNNKDEAAYLKLLRCVYCEVLLLNRRRPGELQRLLVHTYKNSQLQQNYKEFEHAITPSEKILMKRFKCLVIRGKRGRGLPVLFSLKVQESIKLLLKCRSNFLAPDNPYLFGSPNLTTPLCGYKVIQNCVKSCDRTCRLANPASITATKSRKHLATITQLFNMTENDIKQLSNFMGYTTGVHKRSYRLPDDVYQTAKIAKLLSLMEKGVVKNYKGLSLDEIDIHLEENLMEEDDLKDLSVDNENLPIPSTEVTKPKKKRILVPWTEKQKEVVKTFFKNHIKGKRPPKRHECEMLIEKNKELLHNKSWLKIKVFIQNIYSK